MLNPLNILSKFIKSSNQKSLEKLKSVVNNVNSLENEISNLKNEDFPKRTLLLKELSKILTLKFWISFLSDLPR